MSLCISSCSGKKCKNSHLGGHNVSASGRIRGFSATGETSPLPEVQWERWDTSPKLKSPKNSQTEKSANLAHFFESGHILRIKNPMSNLRGSRSGMNYFLLGKLPSNFQGSKSWWGKFPHFPQWWIRPWFRQLCFELNPESPFFFYTSIHLDENMSNVTCYVTF